LSRFRFTDPIAVSRAASLTRGHPLTLSLIAAVYEMNGSFDFAGVDGEAVFQEVVRLWLREVKEDSVRSMADAAAVLRSFDHELLRFILNEPLSDEELAKFTALSFIRRAERGFAMHDLLRDVIRSDMRLRSPNRYRELQQRAVQIFYRRIAQPGKPADPSDVQQFFYHAGDAMVRSVFFQTDRPAGYVLEALDSHNIEEAEQYYSRRITEGEDIRVEFADRDNRQQYQLTAAYDHFSKDSEWLKPAEWLELGHDCAHLLRDAAGQVLGIAVVIPINARTIPYLANQPVTGPYFRALTDQELQQLSVPPSTAAGWYVRSVNVHNPVDHVARSILLTHTLNRVFNNGIILSSSPLPFYCQLLEQLGFEDVPAARHLDYGEEMPSPTYRLDLRGDRLHGYLRRLLTGADVPAVQSDQLLFTSREQDIAALLLEGRTNLEIAASLYVSEITVKKHVSNMLTRAGVRNRAQLVKKIMETASGRSDAVQSSS